MRVTIEGVELPGRRCGGPGEVHDNVHVGLQRRSEVVELHRADRPSVSWYLDIEVRDGVDGVPGGVDYRSPFVQGRRGDRFLYLSWGNVHADGSYEMFRRAKLMLGSVEPEVLSRAREPGGGLVGRLGLTGGDGGPRCAAVRPPVITWSAAAVTTR